MRDVVGVVSDTHDLVRPEAVEALRGCDRIIHAGDICRAHVLDTLGEIAPLEVVRGNNDRDPFAMALPIRLTVTIGGKRIHVIHDRADLETDLDVDLIVFGHSHKPHLEERDGVLWLNPGSAGPRRFKLPVTLSKLTIENGEITTEMIDLQP